MPTYEYLCPCCDALFEIERSIKDSRPVSCSECSTELRRQISRCTFRLKGSGWSGDGYMLDSEKPHDDDGTGEIVSMSGDWDSFDEDCYVHEPEDGETE